MARGTGFRHEIMGKCRKRSNKSSRVDDRTPRIVWAKSALDDVFDTFIMSVNSSTSSYGVHRNGAQEHQITVRRQFTAENGSLTNYVLCRRLFNYLLDLDRPIALQTTEQKFTKQFIQDE